MARVRANNARGGGGITEPLVFSVRAQAIAGNVQWHFNQAILNYFTKIKLLSSADAQQYLNDSYVNVTDTSATFSVNNATSVTISTTAIDISSLTYDPTKEGSITIAGGSNAWRSFCVMLYND